MSAGIWVVAQTKPHQERWAAENAARQGFTWYLPLTLSKRTNNRPLAPVCLFPRYLFVLTEGRWRSLLGTYGITSLVMNGQQPSVLPEKAIESLRARQGSDGLVHLETAPEASRFKSGQAVRVNSGPFLGYAGAWEALSGPGRSKIMLEFLGRSASVSIDDEHLEMA